MSPTGQGLAVALMLALVALVGCGDDDPDDETVEAPEPGDVRAAATATEDDEAPRAAPRWEHVAELDGNGAATEQVEIDGAAIQWRVRYECDGDGRFALRVAGDDEPLVDTACPDAGEGFAIAAGEVELDVAAADDWQVSVDEQLDTPVHEPPLDEMEDPRAEIVATGGFVDIERRADGTVTLYRLADDRLALRIEELDTPPEPGLYVWLSQEPAPATTEEVVSGEYVDIGHVTSTLGDHNYVLPDDVTVDDIRSVVLWCQPVRIAYGAATLEPQHQPEL